MHRIPQQNPMSRAGIALRTVVAALALAWAGFASADRAEARIVCEGSFQVVQGALHATPYCADLNLTRVARSYGIRVTFDQMRFSASKKEEVCRTIGHDPRVSDACVGYRPQDNGRRWPG